MQMIAQGSRSLGLICRVNLDRMLFPAAVVSSLVACSLILQM